MTTPDAARLELRPFARAHLLALVDGGLPAFEAAFGARAADGFGAFLSSGDVSATWLSALRASPPQDPWSHGFAAVHRIDACVIGTVGFKGPPDDGAVEIAYGIVPAYQGRGYATEALTAGVSFAFADARVRVVRAHTLRMPGPSPRVLEKAGFTRVADFHDPEDGLVWRWERRPEQETT